MPAKMRFGESLGESFEAVKASPAASIVFFLVCCIPFLGSIAIVNYLSGMKAARESGQPMEVGALFNFENALDKILAHWLIGIGYGCCFVPGMLMLFALPILADKPGTGFMDAIKGSFAFGKANLVPMLIISLVWSILPAAGLIACCIGMFVTFPMAYVYLWITYEDNRSEVAAVALESGVTL